MSRIAYHHPAAIELCTKQILLALNTIPKQEKIICVCIGTDRSTGDSLGPIVGTFLKKQPLPDIEVWGTLDEPVHAINLKSTLEQISQRYHHPTILAVDACLGQSKNVGSIQVGLGPIKPGAGVNKDLPEIGQIHITGIVNVAGFMEYVVLQNTRLSLVMKMAEIISTSLHTAFQISAAHHPPSRIKKDL